MKLRIFLITFIFVSLAGTIVAQNSFRDFTGGNILSFDGKTLFGRAVRNLPSDNADRTLAIVFLINRFETEESFLGGYGGFGTAGGTYHIGTSYGRLFFSQWGQALFGPELKPGKWYEAVVSNRKNSVELFLNGKLVATGEMPISTPAVSDFYLGRLPDELGRIRSLNGQIASARIYHGALSPAEIAADFDQSSIFGSSPTR